MKGIIFCVITLIYFTKYTLAQCTLNNINTNPDPTYVQPPLTTGYEYKTNTFNWWNEGYNQIGPINTNITGIPAPPNNYVTSPYYSSAADYLAELVNNRDFESLPQNGWELIKQDMGYFTYDNPGPTQGLFGTDNGGATDNYTVWSSCVGRQLRGCHEDESGASNLSRQAGFIMRLLFYYLVVNYNLSNALQMQIPLPSSSPRANANPPDEDKLGLT